VGTYKWLAANDGERSSELSYRVTGLREDTEYELRVAAQNRAGTGPYTEATMPVRAISPEGKHLQCLLEHLLRKPSFGTC
jgi:hypothetical protein